MAGRDGVFTKCAWRLIPFMMLLYVVNFIDRSNVRGRLPRPVTLTCLIFPNTSR